jgi:glycosyltransferase involved in cell wall biosynthesis
LEALEVEKQRGKLCVLDQIDPGEKEHEIICDEQQRWPDYAASPVAVSRAYFDRLKKEWQLADAIIVNSEWSRDCNIAKGAPPEKIEVVPLAYESNARMNPVKRSVAKPCQILWIGRVTLQKGIQYLVEAARLLADKPVEFLICGDAAITSRAMAAAPGNIRWLGKITHVQKNALFSSATAFVLPTVSDGFAITQLEAFAHGLPVIVTPNCGQVVEDGVTGFIVPPRDPGTLAAAIGRFIDDPGLSAKMSPRCTEAVQAFSIDAYGQRLVEIIEKHMRRRQSANQAALIS